MSDFAGWKILEDSVLVGILDNSAKKRSQFSVLNSLERRFVTPCDRGRGVDSEEMS